MTHTLHRQGDLLEKDYVVLSMSARGVNEERSASKLAETLAIIQQRDPTNFGDMRTGNKYTADPEEMIRRVNDRSIVHGVFTSKEDLNDVLLSLKKADLGMSVVVSGPFDEVFEAAKGAGVTPHTVHLSLGVWGKTGRLPKEEYLEISTMCGHAMISPYLIEDLVTDIKKGRITADEAAKKLAKCCVCGVFNPERAASLIERIVPPQE